nr:MAG TPA: hypothetical protein [Caudoviricetes sp.]
MMVRTLGSGVASKRYNKTVYKGCISLIALKFAPSVCS